MVDFKDVVKKKKKENVHIIKWCNGTKMHTNVWKNGAIKKQNNWKTKDVE